MAQNNQIDFYLVPQHVNSETGTATPAQYRLIFYKGQNCTTTEDNKNRVLPLRALAQFTYEQCFNYYNWQGAVRIPGVMQCANKLSTLVGEHIV